MTRLITTLMCILNLHLYATDTLHLSDEASIPLFDLKAIEKAAPEEQERLVQAFGDALRDVGFVAVYVPELTPLVNNALNVTKEYFAQPYETKMCDWHGNNGQSGYSFKGLETAAGAPVPDLKETFFVTTNFDKWPDTPVEFKTHIQPYFQKMRIYADQVMHMLIRYLKQPESSINTHCSGNIMRLAYYPSPKEGDDPKAVWAGAHQDLNAITLLPKPSRSGLQLFTKEGKWVSVVVPDDYIIINCGDQVTMKTAGYVHATEHRVINDDPTNRDPRYSTIFFASWPMDYDLTPFANCAQKALEAGRDLEQYPSVTVEENLTARLIEMGSIPNPSEELVQSLVEKGLLKCPPQKLKESFPHIFE